jgi:AraC-like DNA-binding protein
MMHCVAVAFDCGLGTPDRTRLTLERCLGVTPAQYRATFQMAATAEDYSAPPCRRSNFTDGATCGANSSRL